VRTGGADWLLTIDADHTLEVASAISQLLTDGTADAVMIPFADEPLLWTPRILRAAKPWFYQGTTREYLDCEEPFTRVKVDSPRIRDHADGASRVDKFRRDAELLRAELVDRPKDARRWFYLGESYRGLGQFPLAAQAYTNCAVTTQAPEERYLALVLSGEMLEGIGAAEGALDRYLLANAERPQRREGLLFACRLLNGLGRSEIVLQLVGPGVQQPIPTDDFGGIVPGAYGPLMQAELLRAEAAATSSGTEPRHRTET
jgi:tetratricopeptide (TPR) repeat protein